MAKSFIEPDDTMDQQPMKVGYSPRPRPGEEATAKQDEQVDTPAQNIDNEDVDFFDDIRLPIGTRIDNPNNETWYVVIGYLGSGSFGITYLVQDPNGFTLVLKEFCADGARRKKNLELDFNETTIDPLVFTRVHQKFLNEPERFRSLLNEGKGKATTVDDNMSLDVARQTAIREVGKGGIFKWHGKIYSTYTDADLDKMNIIQPRTDCFKCFGNDYYVMDKANGMTLFQYMKTQKEEGQNINLDFCLKVMEQLAIGVMNIGKIGCVHQDISPNNIIFEQLNDGKVKLKIIDFGMAANMDRIRASIINNNGTLGTYIPGGTRGFTDIFYNEDKYSNHLEDIGLIDIYSLGAILYYMIFFDTPHILDMNTVMQLESQIKNMHKYENRNKIPFPIVGDESDELLNMKKIYNACYELVKKATVAMPEGFAERIQTAEDFLIEIRRMNARVSVDKRMKKMNVDCMGGSIMANFTATHKWTADIVNVHPQDIEWIAFDGDDSGPADIHDVSLRVRKNTSNEERRARVIIKSGYVSDTIHITQAAVPTAETILYFIGEGEMLMEAKGGEHILTFKANKDWNAQLLPEGADWVRFEQKADDSDTHVLRITADANTLNERRSASIKITSCEKSIEAAIFQSGAEEAEIYFLPKKNLLIGNEFNANEQSAHINFFANYQSKVLFVPEQANEWISVNLQQFESGERTLVVTVKDNDSLTDREAEIRLLCKEDKYITYKVDQKGKPEYKISIWNDKRNFDFSHEKQNVQALQFECTGDWSISKVNDMDWLTLTNAKGDAGKHIIKVQLLENDSAQKRTANLLVKCGDVNEFFTITQDVKPQPIGVKENPIKDDIIVKEGKSLLLEGDDTTEHRIVFSSSKGIQTTMKSDSGWLRLGQTKELNGDVYLTITVDKNQTVTSRKAIVTLTSGKAVEKCEVQQETVDFPTGKPYNKEYNVIADKTTLDLQFTCGKNWLLKVDSNSCDWMKVDKKTGSAGTDIKVNLTVEQNTSTDSRTGEVTLICGDSSVTYTIIQKGKVSSGCLEDENSGHGQTVRTDNEGNKKKYTRWIIAVLMIAFAVGYVIYDKTEPGKEIIVKEKIIELESTKDLPHNKGEYVVKINATADWTAQIMEQTDGEWLQFHSFDSTQSDKWLIKGKKGTHSFTIYANENNNYIPRKATIRVTCGKDVKDVHITQAVDEAYFLQQDIVNKKISRHDLKARNLLIFKKYDKSTGNTDYINNISTTALFHGDKNANFYLGRTHDIYKIEKDSAGIITTIIFVKK